MKKNLFKTIAIVASVMVAVNVSAQYTWRDINNGAGAESKYAIFVIDDNTLLGSGTFSIYKSTDKGDNWTQTNGGATSRFIKTSSGKLLAAGNKLSSSTDNGDTWTEITTVPVPAGYKVYHDIVQANNGDLFMIGSSNNVVGVTGVYKSTDDGVTWVKLGTLISTQYELQTPTLWSLWTEDGNTIVVSGQTLLTNGQNTIRSTDGGATWSYVSGINKPVSLTKIIKRPNGILLASGIGGLYTSADTGATFSHVAGSGTHYNFTVRNDTIFTAYYNLGIEAYSAIDYSYLGLIGSSSNGLSSTQIRDIAANSIGDLFAASEGGMKFHTTAAGGTTGISSFNKNELAFDIYPNPTSNVVIISDAPIGSLVNIRDMTGRVICDKVIKYKQETFNTSELSNGVYNIQILNSGSVANKKLVIRK
ncbi:MAG: T9SS type A sorting domain-containing protein [Bacteroidia bacterium]|nr:T9SS type A sorting domain-containing protein [Bacteroidia bacterium]